MGLSASRSHTWLALVVGGDTLRRLNEVEINSPYFFSDKSNPFLLFAHNIEDIQ